MVIGVGKKCWLINGDMNMTVRTTLTFRLGFVLECMLEVTRLI